MTVRAVNEKYETEPERGYELYVKKGLLFKMRRIRVVPMQFLCLMWTYMKILLKAEPFRLHHGGLPTTIGLLIQSYRNFLKE